MRKFYLFLAYFFQELAITFEACAKNGFFATFKAQFVQPVHSTGDQSDAATQDLASVELSSGPSE